MKSTKQTTPATQMGPTVLTIICALLVTIAHAICVLFAINDSGEYFDLSATIGLVISVFVASPLLLFTLIFGVVTKSPTKKLTIIKFATLALALTVSIGFYVTYLVATTRFYI